MGDRCQEGCDARARTGDPERWRIVREAGGAEGCVRTRAPGCARDPRHRWRVQEEEMKFLAILLFVAACGAEPQVETIDAHGIAEISARLPRAPGEFSPSLVAIDSHVARRPSDPTIGNQLADVDSCATCHADAAAQWGASAHSFASFGNPLYRQSVELARTQMGKHTSQHCAGCHDMPLMTDGLMTSEAAIPARDLRAHSGVTCSLCHGVKSVTKDGNGSYVWSREPIDAPVMSDPSSIARHKAQVSVKALGTEICVGCHRGF